MNLCNRTNLSTWENIAKQVPSIKVENGMYISKDNVLIGYEGKSEKLVVPEGITTIANNVIKAKDTILTARLQRRLLFLIL